MRRRVTRVAWIYIVASWAMVEAADVMFPALQLPAWTVTLVAALMILGFPVAMVLAWAFDIGPQGVTRTADAPKRDGQNSTKVLIGFGILLAGGTALLLFLFNRDGPVVLNAFLALGILLAAVALVLFFLRSQKENTPEASVVDSSVPDKSIAVLPFVNTSGDEDNEYFSDGITDELVNVLNDIKGLRVAARTSSFYFKGRNEKIQTIGEELGVGTVLEGSVRKSDDRIRVSVQLVGVADGFHLWSETYDRQLSDILGVQDDIAKAIAAALEVELYGAVEPRLLSSTNVEAYQLYLRGVYLWNRREPGSIREGIEAFRQAVGLEPGFARAYAGLGAAYHKLPLYDRDVDNDATQQLAEDAAREALRLNPGLGEAHATLGSILAARHAYTEAEVAFQQAIKIEPGDATAHHWYAVFLLTTGRTNQALEETDTAYSRDPLNAAISGTRGSARFATGRVAEAIESFHNADTLGWGPAAQAFMATAYLYLDDREVAGKCLRAAHFSGEQIPDELIAPVVQARDGEQALAAAAKSITASRDAGVINPAFAFRLCAMIGSTGIFDLGIPVRSLPAEAIAPLWYPGAAQIRQDPRFIGLVEELGLTKLWQIHGLPDRCRTDGDGIVCD